ncbi:CRE-SEP-1 protein [Caenorhabditis remanei]|uniref:separase n=1 Tax=Caenorhabditis remanei TaxID=31234 RepID=E3LM18_CAERE|nr:CRE-SEP-1 protein [Caenorhabditis remanei]
MRIIGKSSTKRELDDLEILIKDVNSIITSFVEQTVELQQHVADCFLSEFDIHGSIDLRAITKLARITSRYASSESFQNLGKYQRITQKLFNAWQSLRKDALECSSKYKASIAVIPAKLCFFFFYNGELCKAVVCLLDYIELVPEDVLTMEAALRWLMFLGETELAEKKIKQWKMEKSSEDLFEATKIAISYLKKSDNRVDMLKKMIDLRDKIRAENVRSFPKYELASYVYWLCSTFSNVPVGKTLNGCEFPDRMSQLQEASSKAEAIIRNRVPGLAAYQFDNSVSTSIWPFLEEKHHGSSTDYIHLGSTVAWHFEMRREWSLVNVSTAQTRDSMSSMILNWRIALKSASFFRILQMTNLLAYYTTIIEEVGTEKNAKLMRISVVNLLSANPVLVRCSTPKESRGPSRAQTPLPGEKSGYVPHISETMVAPLEDLMEDLDLFDEQPFHSVTRTCPCNVCLHYPLSCTFAAEYMMSYCIHSNFNQTSLKHFNEEFIRIRERGMSSQTMMQRNTQVRPRPNIIQNEVFGMCVCQWLVRKIDSKQYVDQESLEIFNNALKIVRYLNIRTTDLMLAVQQLGRQLEFPQDCDYSWMQPVIKKPRVKAGIENAIDLFRAVSPFGRRQKCDIQVDDRPFDSARYEKIRTEMKLEMNLYGHILYREWRCRLFPYIGRTSTDPWEAGYAWAESTLIGSRNAIQCRLEKCRKGMVTISGKERFEACVRTMPDDMTLVQIAMADDKKIYMIKLHADREPIIMPLAHYSQAVELMDKFTFMLEEDERIAKYPGEMTPEEFWKRRKVVDARMKLFLEEVQNNFLNVAANLLMPSGRLGENAAKIATKIFQSSKGGLLLGETKEMVYLSGAMDFKSWKTLVLRFCGMRKIDETFVSYLPTFHKRSIEEMKRDQEKNTSTSNVKKKYTYLVICPHLSQFCWERLPIFDDFPYVGRQVSIHSLFSQLEAMRNQEKQIPLQIDVQNAYYVLDPENNLGETKRRMLDYINNFNWKGIVGEAPSSSDITTALSQCDAFFYFGHGSGSSVMPRSVIKQSTCNAISMLMGCGSVRTIPQALGFDGKSALHDYAMAKCPLIVGCLWTVTDGEIDRFLIRMVDDCFEKTRTATGIDRLRQLSEAMHEARSKAKLRYLTGAAVVMYGLPVVSKPDVEKENNLHTPNRNRSVSGRMTPSRQKSPLGNSGNAPKTPAQNNSLSVRKGLLISKEISTPEHITSNRRASRKDGQLNLAGNSLNAVQAATPLRAGHALKTPGKTSKVDVKASSDRDLKTPKKTKTFPADFDESDELPKRSTRQTKPTTQTVSEVLSSTVEARTTRSSARTPSRSRRF